LGDAGAAPLVLIGGTPGGAAPVVMALSLDQV
jgi:hypothetical protein